jgi:WD40 repeat protein
MFIHHCEGHDGWVQALSFSSDGLYLASASDDESVRVWDVLTGECIKVPYVKLVNL